VPLESDHVIIGRSPFADVRLDRSSVSRRHAELLRDPFGRWWVRDLDSRGGVMVNGVAVKEINLQPGDDVQISRFTVTFNHAGPARPRTAMPMPAAAPTAVTYDDSTEAQIRTRAEVESPKIDVLHLTTLAEFGQRLTGVEDAHERLRLLCRFMVRKDFHGLAAMALRMDKDAPEDPLQVLITQTERRWSDRENYVSRNVVETLIRTHAPVIASNVASDPAAIDHSSPGDMATLATIASPLHEDKHVFELLYIILPTEFGTAEWLALVELAVREYQQAEAIWRAREEAQLHAAIEQDLESARRIQTALVPRHKTIEGLDLAIDFQPSRWVGGDYVDVVPMVDGRTLLVMADVSGKGLPAALVAQSLHSMVHTCLRNGIDVMRMMQSINLHLCEYLKEGSFVTMACVAINPSTGDVQCVNAGHLPPIILDPSGDYRHMQSSKHYPLGLMDNQMQFESDRLEAGQMLAMYTDGLTEIPKDDGRLLNIEGLGQQMSRIARAAPDASLDKIERRVTAWLDDLEGGRLRRDDRTLLLARRSAEG